MTNPQQTILVRGASEVAVVLGGSANPYEN
jgi:hypothetical protein